MRVLGIFLILALALGGAVLADTAHEMNLKDQAAVKSYIEKNCEADIWKFDVDRMNAGSQSLVTLKIHCREVR